MSALDQMYQEIILDLARRRPGEGLAEVPEGAPHGVDEQFNPTCGDRLVVQVVWTEGEHPVVDSLTWAGEGCSISVASVSVLSETAPGLDREAFDRLVEEFRTLLHSRGKGEPDPEVLGDAAAFAGVSKYVARVKCAMLGWVAAEAAAR